MKTVSTKASTRTARKPASKQRTDALSICPVDGAGWCPYPFSPAQLAKRLKARESGTEASTAGANKRPVRNKAR